jgi:hypothetical protein
MATAERQRQTGNGSEEDRSDWSEGVIASAQQVIEQQRQIAERQQQHLGYHQALTYGLQRQAQQAQGIAVTQGLQFARALMVAQTTLAVAAAEALIAPVYTLISALSTAVPFLPPPALFERDEENMQSN